MTSVRAPMCVKCVHFHEDDDLGLTCDAFPIPPGIPEPILYGRHDHREWFLGDRRIRFSLKPGEELTAEDLPQGR